jgi:hypothetical protein
MIQVYTIYVDVSDASMNRLTERQCVLTRTQRLVGILLAFFTHFRSGGPYGGFLQQTPSPWLLQAVDVFLRLLCAAAQSTERHSGANVITPWSR